ncbi:MAG: hypothetical protein AAF628_18420 [Planctomycetota bacterium]
MQDLRGVARSIELAPDLGKRQSVQPTQLDHALLVLRQRRQRLDQSLALFDPDASGSPRSKPVADANASRALSRRRRTASRMLLRAMPVAQRRKSARSAKS